MSVLRILLAHGLNQAVQANLLSLKAPGARADSSAEEEGWSNLIIAGRPSVFAWHGIGFDELKICVWFDYDHENNPAGTREVFSACGPLAKQYRYPEFIGALAGGWLERREGIYIQGFGEDGILDPYCRRSSKNCLRNLPPPELQGFLLEGPVRY